MMKLIGMKHGRYFRAMSHMCARFVTWRDSSKKLERKILGIVHNALSVCDAVRCYVCMAKGSGLRTDMDVCGFCQQTLKAWA